MPKDNRAECEYELIILLKEYGVVHNFIDNLISNKYSHNYKTMDRRKILSNYLSRSIHPLDWIDQMANWSSTPQGHVFWSDLNKEFKSRLAIMSKQGKRQNRCRSIW